MILQVTDGRKLRQSHCGTDGPDYRYAGKVDARTPELFEKACVITKKTSQKALAAGFRPGQSSGSALEWLAGHTATGGRSLRNDRTVTTS